MDCGPYPFAQLPRLARRDAARETMIARWLVGARAAAPAASRLARIAGGPVHVQLVGTRARSASRFDPHAAIADVRGGGGARVSVLGSSRPIRHLAQRLLGGPVELDAPRPLTTAEHAIWALVIAAAIDDAGVAAEVWPTAPALVHADDPVRAGGFAIELAIDLAGAPLTALVLCGGDLEVRVPPRAPAAPWTDTIAFELVLAIGRCALASSAIAALAVRDVIAIEPAGAIARPIAALLARPPIELVIGDGAIELAAAPGAVESTVATEYSRRDMALPAGAELELTVALGTTSLSVRALAELAVGEVIALGRPLAGPFELRAGGRVIGHGELVDVDGELGVRVVRLGAP